MRRRFLGGAVKVAGGAGLAPGVKPEGEGGEAAGSGGLPVVRPVKYVLNVGDDGAATEFT